MSATLVNDLISDVIRQQARLDDSDTTLFRTWSNPSAHGIVVYMSIVLWNLTNPNEVVSNGAKPDLQLVGPFTFTDDNNELVWYKENTTFHFIDTPCPSGYHPLNRSLKCSIPGNTLITTPNIPLLSVLSILEPLGPLEKNAIEYLNKSIADPSLETLIIRRNVTDIVFGYEDPILEYLRNILGPNSSITVPHYAMLENNSLADRTEWSAIHTKSSKGKFGDYHAWAGNNQSLSLWKGCSEKDNAHGRYFNYEANMIVGTEGAFFQPGVNRDTKLSIFVSELYRTGVAVYNNTVDIKGLKGMRFVLDESDFQTATEFPPNCAYSNFEYSGTLNLTDAVGATVFASKPWFLDGDPALYANLSGYMPPPRGFDTREVLDTFIDIEPYSGVALNIHKRLQTAILAVPNRHVPPASKLRKAMIPVMFADESNVATQSVINQLKESVGAALEVQYYYYYAGTGLGGALLFASFLLGFKYYQSAYGIDADEAWEQRCNEHDGVLSPLLGHDNVQNVPK